MHTDFTLTYRKTSVFYKMRWRGKHVTMGSYGPTSATYAQFTPTPHTAPILVPGHDRPLAFEHWMSGTLTRGKSTYFKVFVGNRGSRRGAFSSTDDKFLEKGEWVSATLLYTDVNGKRQRYAAKLAEGSKVRGLYDTELVYERHRHRWEVNNNYRKDLEAAGMRLSGLSPDDNLVEYIELVDHRFFVATQAHPEFRSRPDDPHPLFAGLVQAAARRRSGRPVVIEEAIDLTID